MTAAWETYLAEHQTQYLEELLEFLRIPSISALPEHAGDVQRAAEWVAKRLEAAGMEHVQVLPTEGHPAVYADWLHAPGKPTVMIYGHFDVQPADPLHLWTNPPFEPTVRDGRVYARGASDDKGNMYVPILAIEALLKSSGTLPLNIKFIFEGQEEIGSPFMPAFVEQHRELLACDLILNADGGQWSETQPSILLALRGGCAVQIDVTGPNRDVHSGGYGGTIRNPLHVISELVASLHTPDGMISVAGFYDGVKVSDADRERIAAVPFDEEQYLADVDVSTPYGEPGFTTRERGWVRPTLDVVGIWGGFQGDGIKTVLPSEAHAKITCRLVDGQDPARIRRLLTEHIERHAPEGVKVKVTPLNFLAQPYMMPAEHPGNKIVHDVLTELYGAEPYYTMSGGSIPICTLFKQHLDTYSISYGFGLGDERAHSPDEFYRLSSFEFGQKAYCILLERLANAEGIKKA
jgi:acetylornithine deacetylase/succinyl-diaminopimelate desuccinylase-like protein